jgi:hypothetical protein
MTAQNQHYVPKFILRQFLSDPIKEKVPVYDKQGDKTFVTSIKNIMAERRFNDFAFEDLTVSFEPVACTIEESVLRTYKKIVKDRQFDGSPDERAALSFLIAFQMVRTKAHRERYQDIEEKLRHKVESLGGRMEDVQGWEPLTEDRLKRSHITSIRDSIGKFAHIISEKQFFISASAPNRSFYLGDNPVCLHNSRSFGAYGNLGLAVPGIEIYMPLASDLMLCVLCPSILDQIREEQKSIKAKLRERALSLVMAGRLSQEAFKSYVDSASTIPDVEDLLLRIEKGQLISSNESNMDYYNSLQTSFSSRYIVCQRSDFALARKFNKEYPHQRGGMRLQLG